MIIELKGLELINFIFNNIDITYAILDYENYECDIKCVELFTLSDDLLKNKALYLKIQELPRHYDLCLNLSLKQKKLEYISKHKKVHKTINVFGKFLY